MAVSEGKGKITEQELAKSLTDKLQPAAIKADYESNPNTNVFTDDEKSKLAGIEAGATKTIINNTLTSSSTVEALSANQGRLLKAELDATAALLAAAKRVGFAQGIAVNTYVFPDHKVSLINSNEISSIWTGATSGGSSTQQNGITLSLKFKPKVTLGRIEGTFGGGTGIEFARVVNMSGTVVSTSGGQISGVTFYVEGTFQPNVEYVLQAKMIGTYYSVGNATPMPKDGEFITVLGQAGYATVSSFSTTSYYISNLKTFLKSSLTGTFTQEISRDLFTRLHTVYYETSQPTGTTVVCKLLDASNTVLNANVLSGADLSAYTSATSSVLKFQWTLTRPNETTRPELYTPTILWIGAGS